MSKICDKCGETKLLIEFHKCKKSKDGHKNRCKICRTIENKLFKDNCTYVLSEVKMCSICQIEKTIEEFGIDSYNKDGRNTACKLCERKRVKNYYTNNPSLKKESDRRYYKNNRDHIISQTSQYGILKYKSDHLFKLKKDISRKVNLGLKNQGTTKNGKSILNFLPYSIQELREHIEKQFEPWMNWNNKGVYRVAEWNDNDQSTWTWQIDHIIPHSTFQYTSMEDQSFKDCWALSNLRPYSAKQNNLDGARL